MKGLWDTARSSPAARICLLLLLADLAFILAHIALQLDLVGWYRLDVERDRSAGEMYQYLKLFAITALFGWAFIVRRRLVYLVVALVFGYLLLDDALLIHESVGKAAAEAWNLQGVAGLRRRDAGELIWAGTIAVVIGALVVLAWNRASKPERRLLIQLTIAIGTLAFFALGVDMLHIAVGDRWLADPLGLVEDGGELIAVTLALAVSLHYLMAHDHRAGDQPRLRRRE